MLYESLAYTDAPPVMDQLGYLSKLYHAPNHKEDPMNRYTSLRIALLFMLSLLSMWPHAPQAQAQEIARYVATNGSDSNPGTLSQPWRTITKGLRSMQPGYTLYIRGGTYTERVKDFTLPKGTSSSRINVRAYSGERPVVKGLLWLKGADYWTFNGINVTWDTATGSAGEHMVKFTNGTGWVFTNAEIWGARSYAAILVAGTPASYTLSHLNVHDTYATNGQWQDHLIYINSYAGGTGGLIERNLLWNSTNGRAIKIGPSSSSSTSKVGNVVIRYNTMYNNLGPTNVNLSYTASDNRIEYNIMQKVSDRKTNIDITKLTGTGNRAANNIAWESVGVIDIGTSGLSDGGGNKMLDPQFANPSQGDFTPRNPSAQPYGRYAP
jgi:hypothetical protein